jgi:hypothetical protein
MSMKYLERNIDSFCFALLVAGSLPPSRESTVGRGGLPPSTDVGGGRGRRGGGEEEQQEGEQDRIVRMLN